MARAGWSPSAPTTRSASKYATDLNQGVAGAAVAWANGYVESFTSWSYAKDAFDKWAAVFARRFADVRGMKPTS